MNAHCATAPPHQGWSCASGLLASLTPLRYGPTLVGKNKPFICAVLEPTLKL